MELSARAAYRGQVTKICKAASEFLSSDKYQIKNEQMWDEIEEELTSFIQRLTAAHESLMVTNKEVQAKGLVKADDLDKEMERIAEYEDTVLNVLSKLKTRLDILYRKRVPIVDTIPNNNTLSASSAANCSIKLPRLQLKKFDGNFQEWLPFWEQFRTAVHENASLTSSDKYSYLETVLVGSAKKVIARFTASEACYDAAVSLLQEQYGDTERLVDKHMQQLISLRPTHSRSDVVGLRNLYNAVTACSRSLTALQIPSHQYYVMLKSILLRCLPVELRVDYYRMEEGDNDFGDTSNSATGSTSTLSHIGDKQVQGIMRFLKREVESLEKSKAVSVTPIAKSSYAYPSTATSLTSFVDNAACIFCSTHEHSTKECNNNMSIAEKRDLLRRDNRCFRCAKRGHSSKKCRSAKWLSCKKCKEALVVPEICIDVLQVPDRSCSSFNNLQLADSCHVSIEAESGLSVLVGSDYYWAIVTGQQRRITPTLRAVKTIFGWTLQGTLGKICEPNNNFSFSFSLLSTNLHLPVLTEDDLKSFWSLEAIGIQSEEAEKHQQAESLIAKCISRNGSRYEAALPWKNLDFPLGSNRKEAIRRLDSLSKRLSRNPEKFKEYDTAMQKLVSEGIAEVVIPDGKSDKRRIFYLPHRPVYKEESLTTKMRIVFDASACTDDFPSLNSLLHVGANLLPDLFKVLLNFRLGRFGIVADVEKAFLQIMLNEKDRDSHRFIWYSPIRYEGRLEYKDYRMTRVTFGVNCSLFLLTAAIQVHLEKSQTRFPITCGVLKQSFYVDDLAISVDSEEEAQRISNEAVMIMNDAGMNLRKWNSNSGKVRSSFCSLDNPPRQKVLGLDWFVFSDEVAVSLSALESFLTSNMAKGSKRLVLQTIARIFDPLGMISPTVIKAKILFQVIWKKKLSWDEALASDLLSEWEECIKSLLQLKGLTIPRSLLVFSSQSVLEIHLFADASMKACGTVAYIKTKTLTGECNVSFLCAKSRIAPLKMDGTKELTLPRLELTAALISARLCAYLKQSLRITVGRFFLWSDSKIVLNWIQGEVGRWKPYVECRVTEIRRHTSTSDWKHCRGKENPADLLTRGISGEQLRASKLWAHGPKWLTEDIDPDFEEKHFILDTESQISLLAQATVLKIDPEDPLICYKNFGNWERLLRVTGYILRFVKMCKGRTEKNIFLSAEELNEAESYWLRYLQRKKFSNEVCILQKKKLIPGGSRIAQFGPFLDQGGLMRLGGRFHCLEESMDFKHPIILPSDSYITELIVYHHHSKTLHGGVNLVLSQLRRRFWIIRGRQLVKKLLRKCVTCQRLWGKPASQPFGPLPVERLKLSRPFDNVGIDFAGPLYFYNSSKDEASKVYLMVFTCAAIRAVHLEMVFSLSTDSCLMGLRRFIARRGLPSVIFSDNAKTFRRAAFEIEDVNHPFNAESFQGFLSNKRVKWKFIVELAPWWGGFWERLIRTIKNVLKVVISKAKLNFENLRTLVIEAEGMVNARPLTYISSDSLNISPLTPADFLLMNREGLFDAGEIKADSKDIQQIWTQRMKYTGMLLKRWRAEYMQLLRSFHHIKGDSTKQLHEGDVVLVFDAGKPRTTWRLAVIVNTFVGRDGKVRACEIRYADGSRTRRPVQLLYPLEVSGSSPVGGC